MNSFHVFFSSAAASLSVLTELDFCMFCHELKLFHNLLSCLTFPSIISANLPSLSYC